MGRLIDANKAQKDFITATGKRSLIIDTAETVPAIPIEWIKRYMKEVGLTDAKYMLETWEKEKIYGKTD